MRPRFSPWTEGACTLGAPVQVVTGDYLYATYGISPHSVQTRLEDGQEARVSCRSIRAGNALASAKVWAGSWPWGFWGWRLRRKELQEAPEPRDAPTRRTVMDMTGRSVELPAKVERVACLEVLCYQKAPHAGRRQPHRCDDEDQRAVDGGHQPGRERNRDDPPEPDFEDLLLKRVDVAFFAYNADRTLKKLESLGITGLVSQPVGRTPKTAEEFLADAKRSVRLFGQVLGGEAEQRAEDWCRDLDRRVAFVSGRLAGLPAERALRSITCAVPAP